MPDEADEPTPISLEDDADRCVLAVEHEFAYEPEHALTLIAFTLARKVLELRDAQPDVDANAVRRAERHRLAALFESEAETLRTMSPDGLTPELVAFMLKLDHD